MESLFYTIEGSAAIAFVNAILAKIPTHISPAEIFRDSFIVSLFFQLKWGEHGPYS